VTPRLEVRDLNKQYQLRGGARGEVVRAVDGVNLSVQPGTSYGLVGESGSGKTTLGRLALRLIEPTSGQVLLDGEDLGRLNPRQLREQRAEMQMVFQNPYSSLNPRKTVRAILAEPIVVHKRASGRRLDDRVRELITLVGLREEHLQRFAHEFSGGQRQRIGIARALALGPRLIVLDEPTSALDVSVQSQILHLLIDLQKRLGLTYLFISHDLAVIRYICDTVGVMYSGRLVEEAPVARLFDESKHPYTQALLSAIPEPDPDRRFEPKIAGEAPAATDGCMFAPRCPFVMERCRAGEVPLLSVAGDHAVACRLYDGQTEGGNVNLRPVAPSGATTR
jgi:oligopeptide/dipeptide ABC transporter ATP-binding protein